MASGGTGSGGRLHRKDPSTFLVGLDDYGRWIALAEDGRSGGLFTGPSEAIRFALSQNGHCLERVLLGETTITLNLNTGIEGPRRSATSGEVAFDSLRPVSARG
jgi:hypothetical protein